MIIAAADWIEELRPFLAFLLLFNLTVTPFIVMRLLSGILDEMRNGNQRQEREAKQRAFEKLNPDEQAAQRQAAEEAEAARKAEIAAYWGPR